MFAYILARKATCSTWLVQQSQCHVLLTPVRTSRPQQNHQENINKN